MIALLYIAPPWLCGIHLSQCYTFSDSIHSTNEENKIKINEKMEKETTTSIHDMNNITLLLGIYKIEKLNKAKLLLLFNSFGRLFFGLFLVLEPGTFTFIRHAFYFNMHHAAYHIDVKVLFY